MSAPSAKKNLIGDELGPYQILELIGEGNLGMVYFAHDPMVDAEVAVKVFELDAVTTMPRETAARVLAAEASATEALIHENITGILGFDSSRAQPYLVMQRVFNGRSLARYCEPDTRLPLEDVVRIVRSCAVGLHHAHERGMVHGDVKPRNILLGVGLEPKLVDFGLSVLMPLDATVSPRYLSPEQIKQRSAGPASDIFNLGVVLYQLLVGQHPFAASSFDEQCQNIRGSRHPKVRSLRSDVPRELQTITNRCLAKTADRRYDTAMHLAADLDVVLDIMAASSSSNARRRLFGQLQKLPYFADFSEAEMNETVHHCSVHHFRPGDEIISAGDRAPCFYIVVDGEVGVRRGEVFEITHLGTGDFVGEVGALTGKPRTAAVIALDRCTLVSVPMTFFQDGPVECRVRLQEALLRRLAERTADELESIC